MTVMSQAYYTGGAPVFSAARIAQLLADDPSSAVLPTPEQAEVIEQPVAGSVLVIAGAGSGKTETMANRVVWLVANGMASPSQVLGLTFTRKAAGELGERIALRLQRFAERLAEAAAQGKLNSAERDRAAALAAAMGDGLELPEVSTYNAFASGVVQEFGGFCGLNTGGLVIDQATAWGIARRIVCDSDDAALISSSASIGTLVSRLLAIDHAVSDNLTDFDEVERRTRELNRLAELPYNEKKREGVYRGVKTVIENMEETRLAVRLARQFADEKRSRGLIEFSDQLALAVETLQRSPEAVRTLRGRTPVVLLDEVQDTSVGQTRLLSTLFAGSAVMAVGDPHQSIYGFRGASASNLRSFHSDFRARRGTVDTTSESAVRGGITLSLSTSWRNPGAVLQAANVVSAPLATALEADSAGISVKPLSSKSHYLGQPENTRVPRLEVSVSETLDEEFTEIAAWMRDARNEHLASAGSMPTAAVVFRSRKHMPAVSAALWRSGVPNRIVGLGGLLTTPEVTDLVSTLRCIWYADASNDLLRLLAGPRFRLGVSDIRGLAEAARWFGQRDHTKQPLSEADLASATVLPDPDSRFTLLDALDEIAAMRELDHSALRHITPLGRERLRDAASMLRSLRREVGGDIPSLLRATAQALRLDIELDAGEHTSYDGSAVARANLDAFSALVEGFLATDERATLDSVLAWLERASEDDEAAEHVPEPEPGTVQLITAHGSKGLEWDLVAVPRLVEGEFPSAPRDGAGWLRPGQLPDSLRGDAAARPSLTLELAETQKEALDAIESYKEELKLRHAGEERRLAYVAFTRAASRLLLTSSFWGGQARARRPAVFLRELEAARLIEELPSSSAHENDPSEREGRTMAWPPEPLGRRAEAVLGAAELLRSALGQETDSQPTLHPVVELLLAEQEAEPTVSGEAALETERLTASTFHEFVENPVEAERRRMRPMPVRPYRRTRSGNLFHEWVEHRSSTALGTALPLSGLDIAGGELDETELDEAAIAALGTRNEPHEELNELIAQFERSRWADRKPLAVELEITMPFAGRTMVCKLDAVYREDAGDEARYEVVDWKSGKAPRNDAERASRFLQLDLYRHAYARWSGVSPERIDVTLFYVAEGQELRGGPTRSLEQLETLWQEARASVGGDGM